jgi:hypothetical protein
MFKINTTFDQMKYKRNIFLYVILLLIVSICSVTGAHSKSHTLQNYAGHLAEKTSIDHKITTGIDSSDQDQMDHPDIFELAEQPECQKSGLKNLPHINHFTISIWQPPKLF